MTTASKTKHDATVRLPQNPTGPPYIEPTPETLARLLELQPNAQKVRFNSTKFRKEAEEYTALINHAHTIERVTLYRLAKRLGVTHGALRFRLARYGYKEPPTATSRAYQVVLEKNRAIKGTAQERLEETVDTPKTNKNLRDSISHSLDAVEMLSCDRGFEAALNGLDELSDIQHNERHEQIASLLRWAAKELRGENV
jgi:hypothetical protein